MSRVFASSGTDFTQTYFQPIIYINSINFIVACMSLHNFIRDHDLDDSYVQLDVQDDSNIMTI
jgi:hypothetical protein